MAFHAAVHYACLQVVYFQTIRVVSNCYVPFASETFAPCSIEFIGVHKVRNYIGPFHGQLMGAFTISKNQTRIDPAGNQCVLPARAYLEDSYSRKHLS
jgi:hypothetical protein